MKQLPREEHELIYLEEAVEMKSPTLPREHTDAELLCHRGFTTTARPRTPCQRSTLELDSLCRLQRADGLQDGDPGEGRRLVSNGKVKQSRLYESAGNGDGIIVEVVNTGLKIALWSYF